jgi:hypothetical protein
MVDHSSEPPSAKGLAVFRDPSEIKRTGEEEGEKMNKLF